MESRLGHGPNTGLSQKYYKPARDAYNNWCVKYGIVPTDVKFAIFHKNYVLMLSKRPQHSLSEKSINLVHPNKCLVFLFVL